MHNNKVLYIEDDLIDQMAFERYFAQHKAPFTYKVANTYTHAVKCLKDEHFNLIISDFYLPDGDAAQIMDHTDSPMIILSGLEIYEIEDSLNGKEPHSIIHKDNELNYLSIVLKMSFKFFNKQVTVGNNASDSGRQRDENSMDFEKLHKTFDGNSKYISDVLSSFLINNPLEIQRLFKFVKLQNWDEAAKIVHKLKSNYNLVGADLAYACILDMQKMLQKSNPRMDKLLVYCNQLSGYTDQVCENIKKRLSLPY